MVGEWVETGVEIAVTVGAGAGKAAVRRAGRELAKKSEKELMEKAERELAEKAEREFAESAGKAGKKCPPATKRGKISVNQANEMVRRGQAPRSVRRVEKGKTFKEQDHVHFDDGSARHATVDYER